jgi:hypothetical protein
MENQTHKEKLYDITYDIFHRSLQLPTTGNRHILAANMLLDKVHISDTDMIYKLAKFMDENEELELDEKNFDLIYEKMTELVKEHINKPFIV